MSKKLTHWGFDHWCDSSPCGANLPKDKVTVQASHVTCPKCKEFIDQEIQELEAK